eukprot:g4787.t1
MYSSYISQPFVVDQSLLILGCTEDFGFSEDSRSVLPIGLKVNMNQTAFLSNLVRVVDMSVKQREWLCGYLSPETRKKMEVQGGEAETQKMLQILERENTKMLAAMQGVSELLGDAGRIAEVLSAPSASASHARSTPQPPASAPHVTHKKEKREAVREGRKSDKLVPNDEALALEYVTELLGASDLDEDRGSLATGVRASMLRDLPWWPDFIHAWPWGRAREAEAAELMREGGYWYGTSATHDWRRFAKYGCEDQKGRGQRAKCISLGVVRPGLQPRDPQRSFSMGAGDLAQARMLGHEHEMIELVKRMADAKLARQWRDPAAELAFLHTRRTGEIMGGADAWIATDRGAQLLYPHVLGAVSPRALSATVVFSLDFPTAPAAGGPGEGLGTPGTSTGEDRWTARLNELAVQDLTTPIDRAPGAGEGKNEKRREAFYPFASLEELEEYMQEKGGKAGPSTERGGGLLVRRGRG